MEDALKRREQDDNAESHIPGLTFGDLKLLTENGRRPLPMTKGDLIRRGAIQNPRGKALKVWDTANKTAGALQSLVAPAPFMIKDPKARDAALTRFGEFGGTLAGGLKPNARLTKIIAKEVAEHFIKELLK